MLSRDATRLRHTPDAAQDATGFARGRTRSDLNDGRMLVRSLVKAIEIVSREPWRREKSLKNAAYFRREIQAAGFDTLGSETHIVPVLIGTELNAMRTTESLRQRGIVAPNARFPAVPVGQARIRFVMTSEHTADQIQYLVNCLKDIRAELNI